MAVTQETRLLALKTALGPNVLAVRSVSLQEQISRLFQIEAELSSEDGEIDLDRVIGYPAAVRLNIGQRSKRYFAGVVSRLVQVPNRAGHAQYRAVIVPWLWLLTRTSDCRIYQEKSVPDIIEDVFNRRGFADYKLKLSASYEKKEYCVQYRETDFNFVSRLMEQEGIYYYFEHEEDKHDLVLVDAISAHKPFPGYEEVLFHELERGATEREVITEWTVEKELQPVAYALTDFDFKKPKTSLQVSSSVTRKYGQAEFEVFDYPGEYLVAAEGERLADVRLAELQSQYEVAQGDASSRGLTVGCTFKLKNHPRTDQNREYLVTGMSLHADAGEFDSGGDAGHFFSCRFTAIPKTQQFRPARQTAKPIVQGPQTAIVVGPSGDEIHTDKHARVKVHFHWDRHDKSDENSSCWVRVSQPWAGKGWGSMATPRIGQEVIIDFLEGDPDRPIITGRVYNADSPPPYAGGQGVVSGLKSQTHKGRGSNEMSMDDTAGKEKITIHAQYDMGTTVEHDDTQTVHNDRSITVDGKHTETIKKDTTIKITEGNLDHNVVAGSAKYHVQGAVSEDFDDKQETIVNKDIIVTSETTKIHITAATEIQLEVGASKLLMKSDGTIQIEGVDVSTKGSSSVTTKGGIVHSEADSEHQIKGAIVISEGSGTNTIKGGMVMLNP